MVTSSPLRKNETELDMSFGFYGLKNEADRHKPNGMESV
jgi:hypothetical protein